MAQIFPNPKNLYFGNKIQNNIKFGMAKIGFEDCIY